MADIFAILQDESVQRRFWSKVNRGAENECWTWKTGSNPRHYVHFSLRGKRISGHRAAYFITRGPVPSGMVLDHLCRNHRCVNPSHLEIVTIGENNRRGDLAKLNWDTVHKIRQLRSEGKTVAALAEMFNVAGSNISAICKGKSWPERGALLTKNLTCNAKITPEQVLEIRADKRKRREIAADYGVTPNMIYRIRSRRSWREI